jgi:hypothetical protein
MRRLDQDVVAGGVAEAVVDRLEVVQVDEEDGGVAEVAAVEGVLDPLAEQAAVGQPGQRVVEGLEGQLLLEGLALLQVAGVEDDAGRVEVAGAAAGDGLDGQPGPVALAEPPLAADALAGRWPWPRRSRARSAGAPLDVVRDGLHRGRSQRRRPSSEFMTSQPGPRSSRSPPTG